MASVAAVTILGVSLVPLAFARPQLQGTPLQVPSFDLCSLTPQLPGFRRVLLGPFDDASVLGPGARSIAYAYSRPGGAYVRLQVWRTADLGRLESYTYQNCLAYHGDALVATGVFVI